MIYTKHSVQKQTGADCPDCAKKVAKSVICSSLLKSAMFGADANWGRVLCAIGYSGASVNVDAIDVAFRSAKGEILVCQDGAGVPFSEERLRRFCWRRRSRSSFLSARVPSWLRPGAVTLPTIT